MITFCNSGLRDPFNVPDGCLDRSMSYSDLKEWDVGSEDSASLPEDTFKSDTGETKAGTSSPLMSRRHLGAGSTQPRPKSPLAMEASDSPAAVSSHTLEHSGADTAVQATNDKSTINTQDLTVKIKISQDIGEQSVVHDIPQHENHTNALKSVQTSSLAVQTHSKVDVTELKPGDTTVHQVHVKMAETLLPIKSQATAHAGDKTVKSDKSSEAQPSKSQAAESQPVKSQAQIQLSEGRSTGPAKHANFSVLSVHDLLAGEPCERVSRHIQSATDRAKQNDNFHATNRHPDTFHTTDRLLLLSLTENMAPKYASKAPNHLPSAKANSQNGTSDNVDALARETSKTSETHHETNSTDDAKMLLSKDKNEIFV